MGDFFHTIGGKIAAAVSGILLLFSGGAHTATNTQPSVQTAAAVVATTEDPFYLPANGTSTTSTGASSGGVATTTIVNNYITQPVIERTLQTVAAPSGSGYITQAELAAQLSNLKNDFGKTIYGTTYPAPATNYSSGGVFNNIALMSKIDNLSGTNLSSITVNGVSGLTDADIPDGITASNYLPLAGGTLSGDLVLTGSLTVSGAQTLSGAITIPYLSATSTTVDSSFVRLTATNATTTNATSTNFSVLRSITAPYYTATSSTASQLPYASSTAITVSGTASTSALVASNSFTFSNVTGFLKAVAGAVSTALINLASDVTGILPVANGGTGWANIAASAIPYGNGSGALATTTAGTAGYVLSYLNGVPTWTATTTFSSGLSYSGGNVTLNTGNANTWTALQQFSNASTSLFSAYGPAYFGGSATSSFSTTGALTLASALTVGNGGTGQASFGQGWLNSDGTTLSASTSPTVNYITATSTSATSTLAGGLAIETNGLVYDYQTNKVGIGTASPSARLSVADSSDTNNLFLVKSFAGGDWGFGSYYASDARVLLSNNASAAFGSTYSANAGDGGLRLGQTGAYSYIVGGTNLLLNPVAGKVGIASTTPWKTLSVVGTMAINGLTAGAGAGSLCLAANKEVVYSDNAGCTGSSLRFKHDIATLDATSGLAEAMQLRPVSFVYNDDIGVKGEQVGFIAEDVAQVDERLITYDASGTPNNVKYTNMVAIAIKAIQELANKINNLVETVAGFAEKLVTKELVATNVEADHVTANQDLCIKKSNGSSVCITGDQLENVLNQSGQRSAPQAQTSAAPESSSTSETEMASTTPATSESAEQENSASTTESQTSADAAASSTESASDAQPQQ